MQAYEGADVLMICYSCDDEDSVENIKAVWFEEFSSVDGHKNIPTVIVGCKNDLRDADVMKLVEKLPRKDDEY